jgi:hypothetical protein
MMMHMPSYEEAVEATVLLPAACGGAVQPGTEGAQPGGAAYAFACPPCTSASQTSLPGQLNSLRRLSSLYAKIAGSFVKIYYFEPFWQNQLGGCCPGAFSQGDLT